MTKSEWRQMIEDLYHQQLARRLRVVRRRCHRMEGFPYWEDGLFRAFRMIRFVDDCCNDDENLMSVFQPDYVMSTLRSLRDASQEVNGNILVRSGIVDVLDNHFPEILSELEVGDLPEADFQALREAGSSNPQAELHLRITRIKRCYLEERRYRFNDNLPLRASVEHATKTVEERITELEKRSSKASTAEKPPKPWFKGLGSICRGTVLTSVDVCLLAGWWTIPISADTTVVGSVASIVTGLGDIAVGIGELRGE